MPIGYITDHYPAVSHVFVQREVLALRRLGVDVQTFSIRRVGPEHVLSRADREAYDTTYAIVPPHRRDLLTAHLRAALTSTRALASTVGLALRLNPTSARSRLWQLFYLAEAIVLWRECLRRGIRHVHAHFTAPSADVAQLLAAFGAARDGPGTWTWSFSAHGADIQDTSSRLLAEKIRRAAFVVSVSDFGRGQLLQLVDQEHWAKIRVVRCGVDLASFPVAYRSPAEVRPLDVLSVGRLVAVKGQAVLVDALSRVCAAGVDARLTIVGDGPLREPLEYQAKQLGIAHRVSFPGRIGQDEIRDFYERADLFCLPSFTEGLPVVLLEAMATGLPVIASGVMGIPELVDHHVGRLVPAGRPDRLAEAIREVGELPDRGQGLGAEGRRRVARDFEVGRAAEALLEVMRTYGAVGPAPDAGPGEP